MRATSLDQLIRAHAHRDGDASALVHCSSASVATMTWRQLDAATERLAELLRHLAAVRPPSCLVVPLGDNGFDELTALVAGLRTDVPMLVVHGRQPAPGYEALIGEVHRLGYSLVVALPEPRIVAAGSGPVGARRPRIGPGSLLLATGGSAGHPRLVINRTIRAAPARPAVVRPFLQTGWRDGQRQLVCSPLYHSAGLTPFVEGLVSGNTAYVAPAFDAPNLPQLVDAHAIDWVQMTPFHMTAVLASGPMSWRRRPRLVHMADHCPSRVKRAFHEALGPSNVYEMYAASEGIGMTLARGDEWEQKPGTVGRGFRTVIRIVGEEDTFLGPYEIGEIYMRSGAPGAQTYANAAGRLRITPDGYATLGDVGHLDEDGYLYLRPRQITTISVGGVTVSATEVETELLAHPLVADAGVCSYASVELGERVVAVVVPGAETLTEHALHAWARAHLSPAQRPRRYVFSSALPRHDTGKLDRTALFALVNGCGTSTGAGLSTAAAQQL